MPKSIRSSEDSRPLSTDADSLLALSQRRAMDLLATREHSEYELRTKLSHYLQRKLGADSETHEEAIAKAVNSTIERAYLKKWLQDPEELSAKLAVDFHRKNKGIEYINNYLESKGLPPVLQESKLELEKARALVKNKYSDFSESSPDERRKLQGRIVRFLASRGFDSETVRKVIYEKFGD